MQISPVSHVPARSVSLGVQPAPRSPDAPPATSMPPAPSSVAAASIRVAGRGDLGAGDEHAANPDEHAATAIAPATRHRTSARMSEVTEDRDPAAVWLDGGNHGDALR